MHSLDDLKRLLGALPQPLASRPSISEPVACDCPFVHRTSVLMADGEVVSCANMYAETIGRLDSGTSLTSVWNNDRMRALRTSLGTDHEWQQCRHCWFREIRYAEQRLHFANASTEQTLESLAQPAKYQPIAWDFRKHQSKTPP